MTSQVFTLPVSPALSTGGSGALWNQTRQSEVAAVEVKTSADTRPRSHDWSEPTMRGQKADRQFLPPIPQDALLHAPSLDANVIQLWEGRVVRVDIEKDTMDVVLSAKIGQVEEHTGKIELQWVTDQDRHLVTPGAIFYLTLFKQTHSGSIRNSQQLNFRRRPAWSKQQIENIESDTACILSNVKPCSAVE